MPQGRKLLLELERIILIGNIHDQDIFLLSSTKCYFSGSIHKDLAVGFILILILIEMGKGGEYELTNLASLFGGSELLPQG